MIAEEDRNGARPPRSPSQPPAVLVLGASSLVGAYLLPQLAQAGYEVHAVSRTPPSSDGADMYASKIHWHVADVGALQVFIRRPSFPRCAHVVSLLPLWKLPAAAKLLRAQGMRRLIAFSSTSALTKTASADSAERELAGRLLAAEDALWALCRAADPCIGNPRASNSISDRTAETEGAGATEKGEKENECALTIFRPTLIYDGSRDRNVTRIAGIVAKYGFFPLLGKGDGLRQPVHAEDLAVAAVRALEAPASHGRCYELGGGETLVYRAMVERIGIALARRVRIFSLPPLSFALVRGILFPFRPPSPLSRFFPRLAAVSPEALRRMNKDMAFDWSAAARDFGYAPRAFHPEFPWRDKDGGQNAAR